ncbi:hypothetical protein DMENIID0001_111080 [Sergentomyia squamirostris]
MLTRAITERASQSLKNSSGGGVDCEREMMIKRTPSTDDAMMSLLLTVGIAIFEIGSSHRIYLMIIFQHCGSLKFVSQFFLLLRIETEREGR